MTVAELKQGVALLGFEKSLHSLDDTAEEHFWHAVNRALWAVNRLRPKKGMYQLYHFSPKNLLTSENHRHRGGVNLVFETIGAKSYTFTVSGTGSCTIKSGAKAETLSWKNQKSRRFFGFLAGPDTTLTFQGEYDYTVTALALWDASVSGDEKDIPEGSSYATYQLSDYIPDFLRLDEKPLDQDCPLPVNILGPATIRIQRDAEGCFALYYRKKWDAIDENTPEDATLPLDEDLCQLLPQLIASELCLDADQDKATYYRRLYQEQAGEVATEYTPHTPSAFVSHNNW